MLTARLVPRPAAAKPPKSMTAAKPDYTAQWQAALARTHPNVTPAGTTEPPATPFTQKSTPDYTAQWQAALAKTHTPDDPRDSTYNDGLGLLQRNRQGAEAGLGQQDTYAATDRDSAIARLAQSRAQALQNNDVNMNKQGLFYSSVAQKNANNLTTDYGNQEGDVREQYRRGVDAREAQRGQLGRDFEQGSSDLFGQAILRALARKQGLTY